MTGPVTLPQLAERIDRNKTEQDGEFRLVRQDIRDLRQEFNAKFSRVYVMLATAIASIIGGIVVALVTR